MSEPDHALVETIDRLVRHLKPEEIAQLKRELVRYANQGGETLPQGFMRLITVARARGFRPV